jgi:hypothetical protein
VNAYDKAALAEANSALAKGFRHGFQGFCPDSFQVVPRLVLAGLRESAGSDVGFGFQPQERLILIMPLGGAGLRRIVEHC